MSVEEREGSSAKSETEKVQASFYKIQFRDGGQHFTASSDIIDLIRDDVVMIKTDHGLEPARVKAVAPSCKKCECNRQASYAISRRPSSDETERYLGLTEQENKAKSVCVELIEKHGLAMHLVKVERFFNGSKIIFFFTADNRVDFRALVKDLVQEFRTRVEMRQVGVRHETKMIGGLGTCGRELCCSSYMKKFDSVSIKMAKEQDLPLNPSKISGVCNRLLCCLTYEYDTYRRQRKGMPKPGRRIRVNGEVYRVKRQNPLQQSVLVSSKDGDEKVLVQEEWKSYEIVKTEKPVKKEPSSKS